MTEKKVTVIGEKITITIEVIGEDFRAKTECVGNRANTQVSVGYDVEDTERMFSAIGNILWLSFVNNTALGEKYILKDES